VPLGKETGDYVTILGRTETPVCNVNACAIVLKIQHGWNIYLVWATYATPQEMLKTKLPGVGNLLYEQQQLIVPGAVFQIKAYALEQQAPWGIVSPG
jgi:hypothetical protein